MARRREDQEAEVSDEAVATAVATAPEEAEDSDFDRLLQRDVSIRDRAATVLGCRADSVFTALKEYCFQPGQRWDDDKKRYVDNPPFNAQELYVALSLIARYGLDPIRQEIHVTRDNKGKVWTAIGVNAWRRSVRQDPAFDGVEWNEERAEDGKLVAMTCTLHSKKLSHPIKYRGLYEEWRMDRWYDLKTSAWVVDGKRSPNWNTRPTHMLTVRTFCHAAAYFCELGDGNVISVDELEDLIEHQAAEIEAEKKAAERKSSPLPKRRTAPEASAPRGEKAAPQANNEAAPPEEDDSAKREALFAEWQELVPKIGTKAVRFILDRLELDVLTSGTSLRQLEQALDFARECSQPD